MSTVFDGMTGIIARTFGRPDILYLPAVGAPRNVAGVFREAPTEAIDQDGHPILIVAPTWRVERDLVPDIRRGDRIQPGNGRTYAVLNHDPSGSPADDAFLICELERIFE
ncbi:hypothetical protein J7376_19115 [Paracoccus sp. R12_1]|nr:hypothetical protein [Paracoccus sp. R12_1]